MHLRHAVIGAALGALACGHSAPAAPARQHAALVRQIDSIIDAGIAAGKVAGASIAVVRGSDTIAIEGFGKANIELGVPTPEHAVYEIGSVTKQFTAAAILQLVEQGKIKLDDDIRVYLPRYNSQGRKIPVRRLLDHTSGIKGYTEMPEFAQLAPFKLPRDTLVTLFSGQPFAFEPGDEEIYNNSAFFLLGQIISTVSGMPYEEYVQKNLFDRAGMTDSYYCSETAIQHNKVTGYGADSAGFTQKAPLSHQWPYSAGSLCASALDLVRWNSALHRSTRILGPDAHRQMVTPDTLNDGTRLGYAKGIAVYPRLGHTTYHHGGAINGFLSENLYFPDESLSVVVLFNSTREAPDAYALKIAALILGAPAVVGKPIDGDVHRFLGTYTGAGRGDEMTLVVTGDAKGLLAKVSAMGDSTHALTYLGNDTFALDETRLVFHGTPTAMASVRVDGGYGNNRLLRK